MNLTVTGHDDRYAVEQLQLSLFPENPEGEALSALHRGKAFLTAVTTITLGGKTVRGQKRLAADRETVRLRRQTLQQSYYLAAVQLLPEMPAWGALAGVRPTKLTTRCLSEGGSEADALRLMQNTYYVSPSRSALSLDCSRSTLAAAAKLRPRDISLYVGIPFCPTRCVYCSFVSRTVGKKAELMEPYLQALGQEIAITGELLKEAGCTVRSVYIGGGTPTTLDTAQLAWLLDSIHGAFDLGECLEFTVEAGRPDTLSMEKLAAIREHGANRISINPQSMIDSVLRACGRPHTAADVLRCYEQASSLGFDAINMDLIAGLPTDSFAGFCRSLDTVTALNPGNITVHTLALKKGADLFEKRQALPSQEEVAQMVDYTERTLRPAGYRPYYLYRQKYMSGSFENVGWSRDSLDCLYNIYMMEELHTILSLGGGGMNKLNLPGGKIQRYHNPKFPEQYITMLPEVLAQKRQIAGALSALSE